ncbi:lysozyme inhibitor LprI family protein [Stenotrophomonas sp. SRS1]|uniref:lysozyme inhibitor LprI family protein n=1 Tax=Stenotrophomonas sp. SRS1 TaxID=2870345 RepID=UPI002237822E|nr:lysozyme inhibitor LprI family protein [Stenotrophomonas sp. SRS1]MCW6028278.1 lysozyme inhibitor LprI family protein [Stenotrophomonas sp. SRS1]
MNRFVLLGVGALALAACSKPAPSDTATPAEPAAPATSAPAASAPAAPASPTLQPPSFDCAKAQSEAETLVCGDARLAALDRQLAALYKRVQTSPDELDIAAEQRGWIKGRDACSRAVDPHRCLVESYQTRLVELTINGGGIQVPATVEYRCDDNSKPVTAVFYNDIDPTAAVVSWGRDQAIVFPVPVTKDDNNGGRWGREGVDLRTHNDQTTLEFYGTTLQCQLARG